MFDEMQTTNPGRGEGHPKILSHPEKSVTLKSLGYPGKFKSRDFILHDSSQEFFKYDYRMVLLYTILITLESCNLKPARKTAETSIKVQLLLQNQKT